MKNIEFKKIAEIFKQIDEISSRNEMTKILVGLYKALDKEDSQILSYMIQGRVAPLFVKSEFNYSEKSILNLLKEWAKVKEIEQDPIEIRKETGDIGDTVEIFLKELGSKSKKLSLKEVYGYLWEIINVSGTGAVERKNEIVIKMFNTMSPLEAKYFSRIICGSLRLGINVKTLLDVFSFMMVGDKGMRKELERVYGVSSDPGILLNTDWQRITVNPGTPVLSRLVERVASFEEVFERLGEKVLVQPKFDGLRCQIHKISEKSLESNHSDVIWRNYLKKEESMGLFSAEEKSADIKLFTRNLEDVTEMFPEIVDAARQIGMESFILDSEILGWNYEKGTFLTYQETMQRRRKYDVGSLKESIPVKAMVFDILYKDGKDLSELDTLKRIEILEESLLDTTEGISLSETVRISSVKDLDVVFDDYVEDGLEGVIVKQLNGSYHPGVRNYEWIKLKKSMKKGLVDTVDLVVVGYYKGSGRRSDLGFGALLGAVYNEEGDSFDAICKVGTGFSDDAIKDVYKQLSEIELQKQPKDVVVYKGLEPDVWVQPKYVFSVEADEISNNIGKDSNGIGGGLSLRFPRIIDFGRDKNAQEATSVKELLSIFEKQKDMQKKA